VSLPWPRLLATAEGGDESECTGYHRARNSYLPVSERNRDAVGGAGLGDSSLPRPVSGVTLLVTVTRSTNPSLATRSPRNCRDKIQPKQQMELGSLLMTDASIALLTALLAGGFGIIGTATGVAVGFVLEEHRENRRRSERDLREIYDRLLKLSARLNLLLTLGSSLPQVSGISQDKYEEEMGATALELSILMSKSENIPEAEDVMRLTNEVVLRHFSEDLLKGLEVTSANIEARLKNQDYISTRNKVRTESKEEKEEAIKALGSKAVDNKGKRGI
jgi:hypothetical protein